METLAILGIVFVIYWLAMISNRQREKQQDERRVARGMVHRLHEIGDISTEDAIEKLNKFDDVPIDSSKAEENWNNKMQEMKRKGIERSKQNS